MLFNSTNFVLFFIFFAILYFMLPHRWRWVWILIASAAFYMSFTSYYILLLIAVCITNYFSAIIIERYRDRSKIVPRVALIAAIVALLGVLFVFKYFNFFSSIVSSVGQAFGLHYPQAVLKILIPVGISFYTFQSLAYLIEVYRGAVRAERHPGIFAAYMAFFPQILAGPIPRPQKLLPQFYEVHRFEPERAIQGLKLIMWGFFKKVVLADRLAVIVSEVFTHPRDYGGPHLIMASIFFSIQIYCDFSGYSDIAIGLARILGFRLMENFRRPFCAESISDLWRRWHISLSSWFRDYLYIPLGGKRVSAVRWQVNLLVTFVLSGLWHGANWTFIIWGMLNGLYIVAGSWTAWIRKWLANVTGLVRMPRLHRMVRVAITFLLFTLAAIFFRANSLTDAFYIISHLHTRVFDMMAALVTGDAAALKIATHMTRDLLTLGFDKWYFRTEMIIALTSLAVLAIVEIAQEWTGKEDLLGSMPRPVRWPLLYLLTVAVLFLSLSNAAQFEYFRF